jgi:hypothetical protein
MRSMVWLVTGVCALAILVIRAFLVFPAGPFDGWLAALIAYGLIVPVWTTLVMVCVAADVIDLLHQLVDRAGPAVEAERLPPPPSTRFPANPTRRVPVVGAPAETGDLYRWAPPDQPRRLLE